LHASICRRERKNERKKERERERATECNVAGSTETPTFAEGEEVGFEPVDAAPRQHPLADAPERQDLVDAQRNALGVANFPRAEQEGLRTHTRLDTRERKGGARG